MKKTYFYLFILTIAPWLTLPLLGKETIKKFLPGTIFMGIYLIFEGRLAEKRKWWWFPYNIKPNVIAEMPLIWGPFFIGSFWILKYTYKKFNLYLVVNILVDSIFTYFGLDLLKKYGYAVLVRLNKFQLSIVFMLKTLVLYGFQVFYDRVIRREPA
ncbi:hypothetical protein [Mesobacillus subterraneus]|uniref:Uncharacterized protein n=1 Tax=Mesobacillus subterraneus TaxID=285983 RepID=A0A427TX73_9BACI|nr:hypothetical protein [Mesobacillus subterraneus]RSD29079.1 hypothetical protein EJA10_02940 [Mesobacillus subterraneus]